MRVALVLAAVALVAATAYFVLRPSQALPLRTTTLAPRSAAPAPSALIDPLDPGRPVLLDRSPRPAPSDWIKARPGFQSISAPRAICGSTLRGASTSSST